jgi:hypothetical protein
VAGAHLADDVVVAALAVEVDRDDGANVCARGTPLRDRAVEERRVKRPGRLVAVDEERRGARVADRVRARGERQVGAGDLVALADAEDDEREVERRGAAREGDRVLDACDRAARSSSTRSPRRRARLRGR